MEFENKKVIEKLINYYKKNADIEDVYRCLANCMIDYNRMKMLLDGNLPEDETERFFVRIHLNVEELHKFIRKEKEHEKLKLIDIYKFL